MKTRLSTWISLRQGRGYDAETWNCCRMCLDWVEFATGNNYYVPDTLTRAATRLSTGLQGPVRDWVSEYRLPVQPVQFPKPGDIVAVGRRRASIMGVWAGQGRIILAGPDALVVAPVQRLRIFEIWRIK